MKRSSDVIIEGAAASPPISRAAYVLCKRASPWIYLHNIKSWYKQMLCIEHMVGHVSLKNTLIRTTVQLESTPQWQCLNAHTAIICHHDHCLPPNKRSRPVDKSDWAQAQVRGMPLFKNIFYIPTNSTLHAWIQFVTPYLESIFHIFIHIGKAPREWLTEFWENSRVLGCPGLFANSVKCWFTHGYDWIQQLWERDLPKITITGHQCKKVQHSDFSLPWIHRLIKQ